MELYTHYRSHKKGRHPFKSTRDKYYSMLNGGRGESLRALPGSATIRCAAHDPHSSSNPDDRTRITGRRKSRKNETPQKRSLLWVILAQVMNVIVQPYGNTTKKKKED